MTTKLLALPALLVAGLLGLAACGDSTAQRATTGALSGGAAGAVVGGPVGAVVGGTAGAATGAAMDEGLEDKVQ